MRRTSGSFQRTFREFSEGFRSVSEKVLRYISVYFKGLREVSGPFKRFQWGCGEEFQEDIVWYTSAMECV